MSARNGRTVLNAILRTTFFSSRRSCVPYASVLCRNEISDQPRTLHTSSLISAKVAFKLSDIGEGIREVAVKEWFVKVGDTVKQFDNICEVQSDKASVTITSRYDGVVKKLYYEVDDTALVGQPLVDIETDDAEEATSDSDSSVSSEEEYASPKLEQSQANEEEETSEKASGNKPLCIPSVRRLAKEYSIDLTKVRGTGKGNRILKEDILNFLKATPSSSPTLATSPAADRVEPIKGFKKAMVKTMTDALKIPTFVYSDEISVTKLSKIRKEVKEELASKGIKISFMPFFIKAASNALKDFPILNSSVDATCENIYYKSAHNIGIAMDTKVGLAVPVIKNVQNLSIVDIAKELNRLMAAGKAGTFNTQDMADGTFAISNIGVIGGTYTKPVILPPQVAIIAIGTTKVVPRFDKDLNVVAEEIVSLSGAADHRIVDGATMAHFVNRFKNQIENPNLLMLNV